jgi:hypothetical protein
MVNSELAKKTEWGINQMHCWITCFAVVRTYRLISGEFQEGAGLYEIEGGGSGKR